MQLVLVLEQGIIDKSIYFDVGLIQLSFKACKGVFNSNVSIFHSNCAEGLHFSVIKKKNIFHSCSCYFCAI